MSCICVTLYPSTQLFLQVLFLGDELVMSVEETGILGWKENVIIILNNFAHLGLCPIPTFVTLAVVQGFRDIEKLNIWPLLFKPKINGSEMTLHLPHGSLYSL